MGKGDARTKKGKIYRGSHGKYRLRKKKIIRMRKKAGTKKK